MVKLAKAVAAGAFRKRLLEECCVVGLLSRVRWDEASSLERVLAVAREGKLGGVGRTMGK